MCYQTKHGSSRKLENGEKRKRKQGKFFAEGGKGKGGKRRGSIIFVVRKAEENKHTDRFVCTQHTSQGYWQPCVSSSSGGVGGM